jgi:hypothetical protein
MDPKNREFYSYADFIIVVAGLRKKLWVENLVKWCKKGKTQILIVFAENFV